MKIVKRKEWRADKAVMTEKLDLPVSYVLLRYHSYMAKACSCEKDCGRELRKLQNYHMTFLGYPDIQFNFYISSDGTVYEGRGWKLNATKADQKYSPYSKKSIDIAYIGNFNKVDPPQEMVEARNNLINYGIIKKYIKPEYTLLDAREDCKITMETLMNAATQEDLSKPLFL